MSTSCQGGWLQAVQPGTADERLETPGDDGDLWGRVVLRAWIRWVEGRLAGCVAPAGAAAGWVG